MVLFISHEFVARLESHRDAKRIPEELLKEIIQNSVIFQIAIEDCHRVCWFTSQKWWFSMVSCWLRRSLLFYGSTLSEIHTIL